MYNLACGFDQRFTKDHLTFNSITVFREISLHKLDHHGLIHHMSEVVHNHDNIFFLLFGNLIFHFLWKNFLASFVYNVNNRE